MLHLCTSPKLAVCLWFLWLFSLVINGFASISFFRNQSHFILWIFFLFIKLAKIYGHMIWCFQNIILFQAKYRCDVKLFRFFFRSLPNHICFHFNTLFRCIISQELLLNFNENANSATLRKIILNSCHHLKSLLLCC